MATAAPSCRPARRAPRHALLLAGAALVAVAGRSGASVKCSANPAGGTNELTLRVVPGPGADLDLGWTGTWHDLRVAPAGQIKVCLTNCDDLADTTCDASGTTGQDTLNGVVFGPPWPIVAGGTGLCVVHEFTGATITGSADYATGEVELPSVPITTRVYPGSTIAACPQCVNGTCDSGAKAGQVCSVNANVTITDDQGGTHPYALSETCQPDGTPIATFDEPLALTTGQSAPLTADTCAGLPRGACGVAPADDACGSGSCSATCTGGACAAKDSTDCIDAKGGIAQQCCSGATTTPCFPIAAGPVTRTGLAAKPQLHPKSADPYFMQVDETLAGTFCVAATTDCALDAAAGLPGPGAVVLPVLSEWSGYLPPSGASTTTAPSTTTTTSTVAPASTTSTTQPALSTTTTTTTRPGESTTSTSTTAPHLPTTSTSSTTTTTLPEGGTGDASATVTVLPGHGRHGPRILVECQVASPVGAANGSCDAIGSATVSGAIVVVTNHGRHTIGTSGHGRVVLHLTRRGRRTLAAAGSLQVTVRVRVVDGAGTATDIEGAATLVH
jgi:hypothetical protein